MACNTCKKKNEKPVVSLNSVDFNDVKLAYDKTTIITKMTEDDWDFVIDVYKQLFPSAQAVNRKCGDCMRRICQSLEHEYKRLSSQSNK